MEFFYWSFKGVEVIFYLAVIILIVRGWKR